MNIKTTDLNTSWKDNKIIFTKQLELNIQELSYPERYPQHWKDLLFLLRPNFHKINTFLDIGCGAGSYYKLLQDNYPSVSYTGIDFSADAIELAKNHWSYENFYTKDFWLLTKDYINFFDVCHMSALFDVMTNGDDALEFILDLSPKNLIISRMSFTHLKSYYDTYFAYDILPSSRFYHNINTFQDICAKYKYSISQYNTTFILSPK